MTSRNLAKATLLVDDARVRVTRFDFAPGDETGWHTHEMDYVITTLTECSMRLQSQQGDETEVQVTAGAAYSRDKGVNHNVINGGSNPMAFVEIELK